MRKFIIAIAALAGLGLASAAPASAAPSGLSAPGNVNVEKSTEQVRWRRGGVYLGFGLPFGGYGYGRRGYYDNYYGGYGYRPYYRSRYYGGGYRGRYGHRRHWR